jgi:hypothetical protein
MTVLHWNGAIVVVATCAVFATLWETKDHAVPTTIEEWKEWMVVWAASPTVAAAREMVMEHSIQVRETVKEIAQLATPLMVALSHLAYLTVWPLAWAMYLLVSKAWYGFYEFVILRLICSETTVRHVRYGLRMAMEWQMARTKQEIAMELAAIWTIVATYYLIRFLNRQRYLDRTKAWIRNKRRKVQMVRNNETTLEINIGYRVTVV